MLSVCEVSKQDENTLSMFAEYSIPDNTIGVVRGKHYIMPHKSVFCPSNVFHSYNKSNLWKSQDRHLNVVWADGGSLHQVDVCDSESLSSDTSVSVITATSLVPIGWWKRHVSISTNQRVESLITTMRRSACIVTTDKYCCIGAGVSYQYSVTLVSLQSKLTKKL